MPDTGGTKKYIEELWVGIKADYASLQAGLKQAQNDIKGFVNQLGSSSEQMRKFGQTTTIVAGAMAGFGYLINSVFAGFEQSMANTFSVLGATKKEMDDLEKYARKMGETTIFMASQAADAMYYLASAGYNANQVMGALKGTLDLAAATQYDLAETTRIVVSTLNAYQLEATEATRVANLFSAVISGSQATMERIGDSMKYVATQAAQLNIPLEQITAALGMLYDAGFQASQAGTYLRQGLVRLQKPTKEAQDAILSMGLSLDDVNPQMHSLVEIIKNFENAGAGAIDKGDELAKIFDVRSAGAFATLIRQGSDALDIMETKITGTSKASEMSKIQIDTFKGSWKLLESAMQETAIQIGKSLQPILRTLQFTLTNVVKAFNSLSPVFKTILSNTLAVATGFGLIVGPMALLVAKIPTLIASVTALGTAFYVSLGWVVGVSIAVTALVVAFGSITNAQQKHNDTLTESVARLKENNNRLIQQKEKQKEVIDSYVKLAETQNKTTQQVEAQKSAFNKIKVLYPSLISSTDDYNTALSRLKVTSKETAEQLESLYQKKAKLRELELRIDITKAKTDLRVLNSDIKNTETEFSKIFGTSLTKLDKSVNLSQMLPETMKSMSDWTKKGVYNIEEFRQNLQRILIDQDGSNKIMGDQEILSNSITNLEDERNELLQKQSENNGKLGTNEQKRLDVLMRTVPELDKLNAVYSDVTGMAGKQLELQTEILAKEQELKDVKEKGIKPPDKIEPIYAEPDGIPTDEEKSRVEQLEREIYELKKKSMENQLSILEQFVDDSEEAELKYYEAKYKMEQADLEFYSKQQKQKLVDLKASKQEIDNVDKLAVESGLALEDKYQKGKKDISDKWFRKNMDKKNNEFKYNLKLNSEDLIAWKETLDNKRIALEDAGKKYTDEWSSIVDAINATTDMINAPAVNKMKFGIEMFNQDKEGFDGKALEEYYLYLQKQLELTQEWSDNYVDILLQMEDVKQQITNRELERNRVLFLSIQDMATATSNAVWAGWNAMWSKYVIGAREAKNDLDAVWIAMKNAFLNAVMEALQAEITKLFFKLVASLFGPVGSVIGGAVMGAATAMPASPAGAVGADVKKTGKMIVHKDELVVPARIVRANDDKYNEAMRKGSDRKRYGTSNYNFSVVVNNPSVNDKKYWEKVVEEHVEPAFVKLKKRFD